MLDLLGGIAVLAICCVCCWFLGDLAKGLRVCCNCDELFATVWSDDSLRRSAYREQVAAGRAERGEADGLVGVSV